MADKSKATQDEVRLQYLLGIGLDEAECSYLMTPFKDMNPTQRATALSLWDKRNNLIATQNEAYKAEQAEAARLKAAEEAANGEEAELDDVEDDGIIKTTRIGDFEISEPSDALEGLR